MAAAVPTILTIGFEGAGLFDPGTIVRFVSALPLGFAAGVVVAGVSTDHLR
jgi:hypothetical protein